VIFDVVDGSNVVVDVVVMVVVVVVVMVVVVVVDGVIVVDEVIVVGAMVDVDDGVVVTYFGVVCLRTILGYALRSCLMLTFST
jgi:hypothetical protein